MKKLVIIALSFAVLLPLYSYAGDIFIRQNKPKPVERITPDAEETSSQPTPATPAPETSAESAPTTIEDFQSATIKTA